MVEYSLQLMRCKTVLDCKILMYDTITRTANTYTGRTPTDKECKELETKIFNIIIETQREVNHRIQFL